jgi:peptide deformylase
MPHYPPGSLGHKRITEANGKIVKWDHPALSAVCDEVDPRDESVVRLAETMSQVVQDMPNAVGLAAPQLGATKRIIAIQPNRNQAITLMFNPEIVEASEETEDGPEGCLSYPGIQAMVRRHKTITVKYQERFVRRSGKVKVREKRQLFTNFDARVIQHEIDHTLGICRVGDEWRARRGEE